MIRAIVIAGYLLIVIGAIVTEIYARSRPQHIAPLDGMLGKIMRSRTARISLIAAWWWFGWHFVFAETVDPLGP